MDARRLRGALDLVGEVADAPTAAEFTYRASDRLETLIAAQAVSFNEWDFAAHRLTGFHDRDGYRPELAYLHELWPQCEWLVRMAPPDQVWRARTMSDTVPLRRLRQREVYSCVYRPMKIDHFLTITVAVGGQRQAVLLVDRDKGEFTDDDRAIGDLVTRPLARIYRSVRTRERLAARLRELERLLQAEAKPAAAGVALGELTARELEVLEHVATGLTDREIAMLLYVSPRTVQKHLQHAYEKLGVKTRTAAAMRVRDLLAD